MQLIPEKDEQWNTAFILDSSISEAVRDLLQN